MSADDLAAAFLGSEAARGSCLLDSCGVGHLGSHLMFAACHPVEAVSITGRNAEQALEEFERLLSRGRPVIFTLSYELGLELNGIESRHIANEPLIFAAAFDAIAVHDYATGETKLAGSSEAVGRLSSTLRSGRLSSCPFAAKEILSDFTPAEYRAAVCEIQERIRNGDTYQTNLTRKISSRLPKELSPEQIFWRLRKNHPAPFASFIRRPDSIVISASPERFFRIADGEISTSPIKGTRPRGRTPAEDASLRHELETSSKDNAENTMIVDLLRNDLGRVCEFGSIRVEKLCEVEEHPTLFHLVSTINGKLGPNAAISDVIRALYPCGSITGAPKISTMRIIDEIERSARGLSMGAIGIFMPGSFGFGEFIDASVAIRTMTIRGDLAEFNVGGGIVIDSDPQAEYVETVTKSLALLSSLGIQTRS